ncbi:MAG: preprotein translocase subunit SecG [Proteobacteria bacterium]|nr:preprotein translocase subunit SecG [Pseudomonadota bacterium]
MEKIILVIHLFLALGLIVSVLLQKSEGGALGIGGSGGGLVSVRGSANFLTRATGIMAGCFISTSLLLAILAGAHNNKGINLDQPAATGKPTAPSAPAEPSVPLSK